MLVLSRRPGEEIIIDGNIRLTILDVHGGNIRLGIAAPPAVSVDRQEVLDRRRASGPATASKLTENG
jgi:carbon storage regulator